MNRYQFINSVRDEGWDNTIKDLQRPISLLGVSIDQADAASRDEFSLDKVGQITGNFSFTEEEGREVWDRIVSAYEAYQRKVTFLLNSFNAPNLIAVRSLVSTIIKEENAKKSAKRNAADGKNVYRLDREVELEIEKGKVSLSKNGTPSDMSIRDLTKKVMEQELQDLLVLTQENPVAEIMVPVITNRYRRNAQTCFEITHETFAKFVGAEVSPYDKPKGLAIKIFNHLIEALNERHKSKSDQSG